MAATIQTELCLRCWGEGKVVVCCDPSSLGIKDDEGCSAIVACHACQGTGQVIERDAES